MQLVGSNKLSGTLTLSRDRIIQQEITIRTRPYHMSDTASLAAENTALL